MASNHRRTDHLHNLHTHGINYQYRDGSFPAEGSIGFINNATGNVGWSAASVDAAGNMSLPGTLDVSGSALLRDDVFIHGIVDASEGHFSSVTLQGPTTNGVLTYNNTTLAVNGTPIKYFKDISGSFNPKTFDNTTSLNPEMTISGNFSISYNGYYVVSMTYRFTSPSVTPDPFPTNYISTNITSSSQSIGLDVIRSPLFYQYGALSIDNNDYCANVIVYLTGNTTYNIAVSAKGIGPFAIQRAVCIRIY